MIPRFEQTTPAEDPQRLRVFVSAYACEPGAGSEPGLGWNFVRALASRHETWVLTRENNRAAIEGFLEQTPIPGIHFLYFDLPQWQRWWKRGKRGIRLYYWLWQRRVPAAAREILASHQFDLAHHVTFAQYWAPSLLRTLEIPFVWGPVGGGEVFPVELRSGIGWRARSILTAKTTVRMISERAPSVRRTARRSAVAFAATPETAQRLRSLGAPQVQTFSAAALSEMDLARIEQRPRGTSDCEPRFLSIGRLNGRKGAALGLRAFASAAIPGSTLEIFGDGPERLALERSAVRLGIVDRVTFHGTVPRAEILERLPGATALLHLSPEESGSFVCLEAMAARVPPIVLDAGGPAVLVPADAGIRISVSCQSDVIRNAATAMRSLAADAGLQVRLGDAGSLYVRDCGTWERKIGQIEREYFRLLSQRWQKPGKDLPL